MLSPEQGQLRKVGYAYAVAAVFGNNLKEYYFTLNQDGLLRQLQDANQTSQVKRQWKTPFQVVEDPPSVYQIKYGGFPFQVLNANKVEGGSEAFTLLACCEGERIAWMTALRARGSWPYYSC